MSSGKQLAEEETKADESVLPCDEQEGDAEWSEETVVVEDDAAEPMVEGIPHPNQDGIGEIETAAMEEDDDVPSVETAEQPAAAIDGDSEVLPAAGITEAILALQGEVKAAKERLLRSAADHDNFKKRARRDQTDAVQRAENKVVLDFLPVIDNLERAISHADTSQESKPAEEDGGLGAGVKMVHKQFLATLARYQIEPFESVGNAFDPELHEAIQQVSSEKPRHSIVAEVQRGYKRGGKLVRAAQVVVSTGPAPESDSEQSESAPVAADVDEGRDSAAEGEENSDDAAEASES